jgi:hypothetical protein
MGAPVGYAGSGQTLLVYQPATAPINTSNVSAFWNTFAVILPNVSNPALDGSPEAIRVARLIQKWKSAVSICTSILVTTGPATHMILYDWGWTWPTTQWNAWQIDTVGSNRATWDTVTTDSNATGYITWTPYNGA